MMGPQRSESYIVRKRPILDHQELMLPSATRILSLTSHETRWATMVLLKPASCVLILMSRCATSNEIGHSSDRSTVQHGWQHWQIGVTADNIPNNDPWTLSFARHPKLSCPSTVLISRLYLVYCVCTVPPLSLMPFHSAMFDWNCTRRILISWSTIHWSATVQRTARKWLCSETLSRQDLTICRRTAWYTPDILLVSLKNPWTNPRICMLNTRTAPTVNLSVSEKSSELCLPFHVMEKWWILSPAVHEQQRRSHDVASHSSISSQSSVVPSIWVLLKSTWCPVKREMGNSSSTAAWNKTGNSLSVAVGNVTGTCRPKIESLSKSWDLLLPLLLPLVNKERRLAI